MIILNNIYEYIVIAFLTVILTNINTSQLIRNATNPHINYIHHQLHPPLRDGFEITFNKILIGSHYCRKNNRFRIHDTRPLVL